MSSCSVLAGRRLPCALAWCLLLAGLCPVPCAARDYVDGFEEGPPSWELLYSKESLRVLAQRRNKFIFHTGLTSENVEIDTPAERVRLALEHPLPRSFLLEESQVAVWLRSNRDGARLGVRVVLPRQVDPRTGKPMQVLLEGNSYSRLNRWERLECSGLETLLQRKLPQLRSRLAAAGNERAELDVQGAYVDRAVIDVLTGRGATEFFLDDLTFGPIVEPNSQAIVQAGVQEAAPPREVEFRLDRLLFQGRPYFPRAVPYHGETAEDLARMHFNLAWIPDFRDKSLLDELTGRGLRAIATPPRARTSTGEFLDEREASLAPFGPDTAAVLFWMMGTRIPAEAKAELVAWSEQVRNADSRIARPLMGDVAGLERTYSRHLTMLGASRHPLNGTIGMMAYSQWLVERRNQAQPGSFLWTWIQTEPPAATVDNRRAAGHTPIIVEPEQLRLLVYSALAAGYRGLGYWTHGSLDNDQPGAKERKLMIAQLNLELELLEPWLATGTAPESTVFTAQIPTSKVLKRSSLGYGDSRETVERQRTLLFEAENENKRVANLPFELSAVTLKTDDYGQLILPVWYGQHAQFVPDQMAANNAEIIVAGTGDSASAWEVSTTGLRSLTHKPAPGGMKIKLEKFDMTAAIVVTSDQSFIQRLRQKIETMREASADLCLELARAKLERVSEVDAKLRAMKVGQSDAPRLLATAQYDLNQAEAARKRNEFHDSRMYSTDCLQVLRILQRAYWNDAVRSLYTPVSSPHTVCFQTLPDHWELINRFGRSSSDRQEVLLRSGGFEDFETLVAEGWQHEQNPTEGIRAAAELYPRPRTGTYCLRLVAASEPGRDPPLVVPQRPVTVISPPVTVRKGQIIYIGGWARVVTGMTGSLDGALLYDSIGGPTTAIRFGFKTDWQHFELLREVPASGDLTLTMTLTGLGEIQFDDLQIIAHDIPYEAPADVSLKSPTASRWDPLDLIKKRMPRLGPAPGNK